MLRDSSSVTPRHPPLALRQFITFLSSKGVSLKHNEAEAAAARFDLNFDRRVDLDAFIMFYKGGSGGSRQPATNDD